MSFSRQGLTALLAAGSPAHLGKGVPDTSDPHAQSNHFFARKAVLSSLIARFRTLGRLHEMPGLHLGCRLH